MTEEAKPIVTIPVADLLCVTPFKGTQDMRYYLNGVCITPYEDHALLMATNGHWMAIYESQEAHTDKERILDLPAWFIEQMADTSKAQSDDDEGFDDEDFELPSRSPLPKALVVADEKSRIVISDATGEVLVKPGLPFVDGKFPDVFKVLPDPATLERGMFNPVAVNYLGSLHEAIPAGRGYGVHCFHQRDTTNKPVVFRFDKMPGLIVALMTMREDAPLPDWPKWAHKPAAEQAS